MIEVSVELARNRDGGRVKVMEEGRCRMCLRPWSIRRWSRHHLVPQRWFNAEAVVREQAGPFFDPGEAIRLRRLRDADANIVPLCEACHREVEHDVKARRLLRKLLGATEVAFAIKLRGRPWFDEMYPPRREPLRAVA